MFRKENFSRGSDKTNTEKIDLIVLPTANEIRGELSQFDQDIRMKIASSWDNESLLQIEAGIDAFMQLVAPRAALIWDKTLNAQIVTVTTHLYSLINKKIGVWKHDAMGLALEMQCEERADYNRRESIKQKFLEDSETQAAFDRLSAYIPEKDLETLVLVIGDKSKNQLKNEIKEMGSITGYAESMMDSSEFTTAESLEPMLLVKLSPNDIGFTKKPTMEELFVRAKKLGLDVCPAEVGPHLRLVYTEQPKRQKLWIGMEPIVGCYGDRSTFQLTTAVGMWLADDWGYARDKWKLDTEFVFCLPKQSALSTR